MPQLTVIVDESIAQIVRKNAETQGVSVSHYLNNLIQHGLFLEENTQPSDTLLISSKHALAFKKSLELTVENLALTKYLVKNLGDESFEKTNQQTIEKAHQHAKSYVEGLFEE